jgi:hypothetical protein
MQAGRLKLVAILVSACMSVVVAAGTTAAPASAAYSYFCGVLTPSFTFCPGYGSSSYGTWWTYTQINYYGGGNLPQVDACMADTVYGLFSACWVAYNATAAGGCWNKNYGGNNDYGEIYFYEPSGAHHTIYGYNDDHARSGCVPAFYI